MGQCTARQVGTRAHDGLRGDARARRVAALDGLPASTREDQLRALGTTASDAAVEKLPDEAHDVGLDFVVRRAHEEFRNPARADAVVLPEVLVQ